MHPLYERANAWSKKVIGASMEVHTILGPGLLEHIYEQALMHELSLRSIPAVNQMAVPVEYKEMAMDQPLTLDVLVDECLILELKAVEKVLPIHKAQLLSYMKLMDIPLGLLINFHEMHLKDGVHRLILRGSDEF